MRRLKTAAVLLLTLSACSGSSGGDGLLSGDGAGDMWVVSCSLGCTNGLGGEPVFCSIVNTFQNQELSILFSEPIELFSVNTSSFRVLNVANGTSPSGQFFLDPLEPRRLIFRPSLSFDSNGNPVFGFEPDTTYQIAIPGTDQGDGPPYILSQSGRPNRSRMDCTILTSEGLTDPVPGAPTATISAIQVALDEDGEPLYDSNGDPVIPQDGAGDPVYVALEKDPESLHIYRGTAIRVGFNDIMNVATLLNPATGDAPFISVEVDEDGSLSTLADREEIPGSWIFSVDQETLETHLTFISQLPFPSAGPAAPLSPRRVVLTIPSSVQDLVSNPVLPEAGGGTTGMVPELSQFGEITLPYDGGEDFTGTSNEDTRRSGGVWGGGRLAPGLTGGGGQLGDLVVPSGSSIVLNTDSQQFPLAPVDGTPFSFSADLLGNPDPAGGGDPLLVDDAADFPTQVTISDGGFTFSVVEVMPGASLRFEGEQPARLWSRGTATVHAGGVVDMVGATPLAHDSQEILRPSEEISPLPNASGGGVGGYGADRFDMSGNADMLALADAESDAVVNPGADPDGRAGEGVDGGGQGAGPGGLHNPSVYPTTNTQTDPGLNNGHGVTFNVISAEFGHSDTECRSLIVGQAGGGGAYATDGGSGHAEALQSVAQFPSGAANAPVDTPGGASSEVGLALPNENNAGYTIRKLEWTEGNLRGGSGGGGGGNHPVGTHATGYDGSAEEDCIDDFALSRFRAWHDHSGAQGGYGGGALHFVSGRKLVVGGVIDLRGGRGGQPRGEQVPNPPFLGDFGRFAMPGGGGSGGALRLVGRVVEISDVAGRIDLRGGGGGQGYPSTTHGGAGGTGLLRVEDEAGLVDRSQLADDVAPFDPIDDSLGWISVAPGALTSIPTARPDSMSASTSCWMRPSGGFYQLNFVEDEADPDTGDPALMGWNMNVIWDDGSGEVIIPFRGANSLFNGSFESQFGKLLGYDLELGESAAPLVVRFQGARFESGVDLCAIDLNDPLGDLIPGSLTPWVDHPALLNTFATGPNAIRFAIVFDGTVDPGRGDTPGDVLTSIKGVTGVAVRVEPD